MPNQPKNPAKRKRRVPIKLYLSEQERELVEEKCRLYGYASIAPYVRDAAVYENIIVEDLKGKMEVMNALADLIELNREIKKAIGELIFNPSIPIEETKKLVESIEKSQMELQELKRIITEKLSQTYEETKQRI